MADIASAILTASGTIGGCAIMLRWMNNKIDNKVGKEPCEVRHKGVKADLERGDKKFEAIIEKLDLLPAIKNDIEWLKKNGKP